MSEDRYTTSFNDFVKLLHKLHDEKTFKNYIKGFLKHHDHRTPRIIDKEKGEILVYIHNTEPSFKEDVVPKTAAGDLLEQAEWFCNDPYNIYGKRNDKQLKKAFDDWDNSLKKTENLIKNNSFLNRFPDYFRAVEKLRRKLKILKKGLEGIPDRPGKKSSLSTIEQSEIIDHAEHLQKSNPKEYEPRKGSYVSERLKDQVTEDLLATIPKISRHKVARILHNHFSRKKNG